MSNLVLIVSVAGETVALPTTAVESVVEIEGITPVPRSAPHVAGLAALRSRVLTVIDSAAALGLGTSAKPGINDAVIVHLEGHAYALLIDGVEDVAEAGGDVHPLRGPLLAGWQRAGLGLVEIGGRPVLLIDPAAVAAGPSDAAEAA